MALCSRIIITTDQLPIYESFKSFFIARFEDNNLKTISLSRHGDPSSKELGKIKHSSHVVGYVATFLSTDISLASSNHTDLANSFQYNMVVDTYFLSALKSVSTAGGRYIGSKSIGCVIHLIVCDSTEIR